MSRDCVDSYVADLLSQLPENVVEDIRERQRRSVFWDEVDRCLRNKKSAAGVDENILLMNDQGLGRVVCILCRGQGHWVKVRRAHVLYMSGGDMCRFGRFCKDCCPSRCGV